MAFAMSRPSTPPAIDDTHGRRSGADFDLLQSALHNALEAVTSPPSSPMAHQDLSHDKERLPNIDILVNQDLLLLKGVGVDVSPTLLQGHVIVNLAESTSIKEITLQFRGKARLPPPANEPLSLSSGPMTYLVCSHDWSFLEGDKKHQHTLKAGRHVFPFQLNIGGSLPSSITTSVFGGASIAYKLRAVATRPGFAHNLQAQIPIYIARSFAPEALEYQQTLEIENTWPEKIMYSIMIPHKAWAAGDTLTAVVKFSPLTKGVRVLHVTTTINETVKLYTRTGWQENTRPAVTTKHDIVNGRAVLVEDSLHRPKVPHHHTSYLPHARASQPPTPGTSTPALSSGQYSPVSGPSSARSSGYFPPVHPTGSEHNVADAHLAMISHVPEAGPSSSSHTSEEGSHPVSAVPLPGDFQMADTDVVSTLDVPIPMSCTPTHSLEPIMINHRIRWSILISNLDGHTSELRCSLPLHILDHRLIDEARSATAQTRRLLLGGPEIEQHDEDLELPSYSSHVRDRVANMYLPEQSVMRVTNPWVHQGVSPVQGHEGYTSTGVHTPLEAHHVPSTIPGQTYATNLEYVNSELLLSLSHEHPPPLQRTDSTRTDLARVDSAPSPLDSGSPSQPDSQPVSHPSSRPHSRWGSRRGSRAPSPEREATHETFVHAPSASRSSHGLFHISMKPFTSISSPFSHSSRGSSHTNLPSGARTPPPPPPPPMSRHHTTHSALHRAFTEVPGYEIASRGFLGGVPPLSSMQDLPSYGEATRHHTPEPSPERQHAPEHSPERQHAPLPEHATHATNGAS